MLQKNNAVKLVVATDGTIKSEQQLPTISGYEEVRSIVYNYDTKASMAEVEIKSDKEISNSDDLISSIVRTAPDSIGIRVICNAVSRFFDLKRDHDLIELDGYGRVVC
ncbi:MAG: hypothetical protein NC548_45970 [Lachnospiraceae bacterium]|nr:hypothetical protein [Lachnospiraceae bacterium]